MARPRGSKDKTPRKSRKFPTPINNVKPIENSDNALVIADHIGAKANMKTKIYASEKLMEKIRQDSTYTQLKNMTHLPGIHKHALAMPDAHQGYILKTS